MISVRDSSEECNLGKVSELKLVVYLKGDGNKNRKTFTGNEGNVIL